MTGGPVVHIVDDEDSVRRSTRFVLAARGYTVRTWESGVAFLRGIAEAEPGCVLLDVRMPEIDGLEVQERLLELGVTMPVIVCTGHGDIAIAVRAMKNGAVDFLEKPFDTEVLAEAIERALSRLTGSGAADPAAGAARAAVDLLTPQEREVLKRLAQGHANATVAQDLALTPRAAELLRATVMQKLGARNLSDALRAAFAAGLGADN